MRRADHVPVSVSPAGLRAVEETATRVELPGEHPAWLRDAIALSRRAKAALRALAPLAVCVLSFWDHLVTRTEIDGLAVEIDAAGAYRAF